VVLYGCETWSLTVREEHRLRVFGLKRGEVTGSWRKLYNEGLHNFYPSPSIIRMMKSRRMRWTGHLAQMGAKRIMESQKKGDHLEDHDIGQLIVLK
jgi:hypothetical protein